MREEDFMDEEDEKERPEMREIRLWESKGTIVSSVTSSWSREERLSTSINNVVVIFLQPLGVQIFTPRGSRPKSTSSSSSSTSSSSYGVPILPYAPPTNGRTVHQTVLLVLPRSEDGPGGVPELEVGLEVMDLMEVRVSSQTTTARRRRMGGLNE